MYIHAHYEATKEINGFHRLKDFSSFLKLWFLAFKEVKAMSWSVRLDYCFKPNKTVIRFPFYAKQRKINDTITKAI